MFVVKWSQRNSYHITCSLLNFIDDVNQIWIFLETIIIMYSAFTLWSLLLNIPQNFHGHQPFTSLNGIILHWHTIKVWLNTYFYMTIWHMEADKIRSFEKMFFCTSLLGIFLHWHIINWNIWMRIKWDAWLENSTSTSSFQSQKVNLIVLFSSK